MLLRVAAGLAALACLVKRGAGGLRLPRLRGVEPGCAEGVKRGVVRSLSW